MKNLFFLLLVTNFCHSQIQTIYPGKPIQRQVYFVGNSIFDKDGTNSFGRQYLAQGAYSLALTNSKNCSYQCYAVSGRTGTQLLSDIPTKVAPYLRPKDVVVFTEITNDIAAGLTPTQAYNNVISCRDLVRAKGAYFVIATAIARNGTGDPANITANIQAANDLIRNNPSAFDGIADMGAVTYFINTSDCSNTTYYFTDLIHPTNLGYDLLYPVVYAAISALL